MMPTPDDRNWHTDSEIENAVELRDCPFCGKAPTPIDCGDYTDVVCCMSEIMGDGIWNKRPIEDRLRRELAASSGLLDEIQKLVDTGYGEGSEYFSANLEDILAKRVSR